MSLDRPADAATRVAAPWRTSLDLLEQLACYGTPQDGAVVLSLSAGLDGFLERFARDTLPFLAAGGSELRFFEAPYGRGKTHLLRALEATARASGFVTAMVDCSSAQRPFASLVSTYRLLAKSLRPPGTEAECGVPALLRARLASLSLKDAWALVTCLKDDVALPRDLRNVLSAYGRAHLQSTTAHQHSGDVLRGLEDLLQAPEGISVRLAELYKADTELELPRPLGKLQRRTAAPWLRSLLHLPHALGYPGIVVFFDETERASSLGATLTARRDHLQNLRNLADYVATGSFSGCAIHYAVVDDFLEQSRETLAALNQRIERRPIRRAGQPLPNPRAVWLHLDDITDPAPHTPAFYEGLVDRMLTVCRRSGLTDKVAERVRADLADDCRTYPDRPYPGAVRAFVKRAASTILDRREEDIP